MTITEIGYRAPSMESEARVSGKGAYQSRKNVYVKNGEYLTNEELTELFSGLKASRKPWAGDAAVSRKLVADWEKNYDTKVTDTLAAFGASGYLAVLRDWKEPSSKAWATAMDVLYPYAIRKANDGKRETAAAQEFIQEFLQEFTRRLLHSDWNPETFHVAAMMDTVAREADRRARAATSMGRRAFASLKDEVLEEVKACGDSSSFDDVLISRISERATLEMDDAKDVGVSFQEMEDWDRLLEFLPEFDMKIVMMKFGLDESRFPWVKPNIEIGAHLGVSKNDIDNRWRTIRKQLARNEELVEALRYAATEYRPYVSASRMSSAA